MHVSLRQLKIFEAVARHLSYTRAAEELFLTQPAVFTQVKQLEESVGLTLTFAKAPVQQVEALVRAAPPAVGGAMGAMGAMDHSGGHH